MQKFTKLSLVLVALLSSLDAQESQNIILEPITISSTAIPTDELKSTAAVEVYTAKDIQKAHVQNIYEFLNSQTSVTAMPSYGNPFSQRLDMHGYGGDGYQNIVITLNGRKINNIDMVAPLLSAISPASISRIEIIKSSGIITGGDGANAGVINITTKKNNDKSLTIYGGTYGTFDGSFYIGHSDEKLSVSASGESQKNSGLRYIDDEGDKDRNKLTIANLNISYMALEELELRGGVNIARTDVIYASSLTKLQYDQDPTQKSSNYYPSTHQTYDSNALDLGATYTINDSLSVNIDGAREKKRSEYITYLMKADYQYDSAKMSVDYEGDMSSVVIGVDMFNGQRDSHATKYTAANSTKKDNLAAYIMTQFEFGDSSLTAGYRHEKVTYNYNDISNTKKANHSLNGFELGYNYQISQDISIFTNFTHSYQAPDIDRFFTDGKFNNFIEPSQANSYTIGFNHITPTNKFKISAYYIALKDEIYYYKDAINPYPNSLSVNTNIDRSSKYGLDLYNNWLITQQVNISLNYNYVNAKIDNEIGRNGENYAGKSLPGVSKHSAKATLSYLPTDAMTIALTQIYRSKAYAANDFENNFAQKQDAYNSTDISFSYMREGYEIFAKINNLFNQENGIWIRDDAIYPVNFTTTAIVGFTLKY